MEASAPPEGYPEQKETEQLPAYPGQQQAGYPTQQFPPQQPQQQSAYPQQAYPTQQQAYPPQQQAYPPQTYPASTYQPAYPSQQPGGQILTSEAPPPYYPGQQQQSTNNTVVVTSQPTPQVHTVYHRGSSEYGLPAIIFAVAITICFLSLGCWHAILCSAIGIALAVGASSSASNGDMITAKQYNSGSLACTVVSLVSAILPFIALVIWIIAVTSSA